MERCARWYGAAIFALAAVNFWLLVALRDALAAAMW